MDSACRAIHGDNTAKSLLQFQSEAGPDPTDPSATQQPAELVCRAEVGHDTSSTAAPHTCQSLCNKPEQPSPLVLRCAGSEGKHFPTWELLSIRDLHQTRIQRRLLCRLPSLLG